MDRVKVMSGARGLASRASDPRRPSRRAPDAEAPPMSPCARKRLSSPFAVPVTHILILVHAHRYL
jgi:hypothetical protein